jgi:hypothetical protein
MISLRELITATVLLIVTFAAHALLQFQLSSIVIAPLVLAIWLSFTPAPSTRLLFLLGIIAELFASSPPGIMMLAVLLPLHGPADIDQRPRSCHPVGQVDDGTSGYLTKCCGPFRGLGRAVALAAQIGTEALIAGCMGGHKVGRHKLVAVEFTLAAEGRCVLVASHLLAEVVQVADRAIIISRGRALREADVAARGREAELAVRVDDPESLAAALRARHGAEVSPSEDGRLLVRGASREEVGRAAAEVGATVFELTSRSAGESLERLYLALIGRDAKREIA